MGDRGSVMPVPSPLPPGQAYGSSRTARHRPARRSLASPRGLLRYCWCGRSFASPWALRRHKCDTGHIFGPEYQLQNDNVSGDDDDFSDELQDFDDDLSGSILSESIGVSSERDIPNINELAHTTMLRVPAQHQRAVSQLTMLRNISRAASRNSIATGRSFTTARPNPIQHLVVGRNPNVVDRNNLEQP